LAQRRDLGDVLHHFIPEEEQREAREAQLREGKLRRPHALTPARWVLTASPHRPLSCSLALDLAAALSRSGAAAHILAPFPAGTYTRSSVPWKSFDSGDPESLREALQALPGGASALVLMPPEELGSSLSGLDSGLLSGLLLVVDAAPWGLTRALRWLRGCGNALVGARIGVVVVGAESPGVARDLFRKLASAAGRQLGLELEDFGDVERDATSFRSLLRGVPVLDLDAAAGSSRSLESLCRRLEPAPAEGP
jgi:hypothetical protein